MKARAASMKAFISWSGRRELQIAQAVDAWLKALVPDLQSFVSPDLPKGKTWFESLAQQLQDARIGFMCMAPPRVASEWQLVEAGAIWKASRDGGRLFPLSFRVRSSDIPEPLRAFQLTQFDAEDFARLAAAVVELVEPRSGWTAPYRQAFETHWPVLRDRVEAALNQPDDGVHTARGFFHEVAGGWWERVWSGDGKTRLSWMWFEPSRDGVGQTITGRGFGPGGATASRWQTDLVSVQAALPEPIVTYYWEGRHPGDAHLLYGGKGTIRFSIAPTGRVEQGSGEFGDVCLSEARPPTTKIIDLQRASAEETATMRDGDEAARRALAARKLRAWK